MERAHTVRRDVIAYLRGHETMNGSIRCQEDALFSALRAIDPDIIDDGVINEAEFLSAKYRILYVLKEVNGGKGWSLREFVGAGARPQTWDNIARWTEAILRLDEELPWSYWEANNAERRKAILQKIAVVNVKKTSGGNTSDSSEIHQAALQNGDILKQQIGLYHPDITICCGTASAYVDACYQGRTVEWRMTNRGIWYFIDGSSIVVSFSHPAARVRDCFLLYALTDAVKEIISLQHRTEEETL